MSGPAPLPLEAIRDLVASLACVQVAWRDQAQRALGMANPQKQAWVYLTLGGYRGKGVDEQRTATDPNDATKLVYSVGGYRIVTVGMRCESLDWAVQPADVLERVRLGLRTMVAAQKRADGKLALIGFAGGVVSLGRPADNRTLLVANLDVRMGWASVMHPEKDDGTTIATVDSATAGRIPGTYP